MTLTVAIASENDSFDGEVYRVLLAQLLGVPVVRWVGSFAFNGYKSVAKVAPAFLLAAAAAGVEHALFAIDNDGGASRNPEHEPSHVAPPFDLTDDRSCRECWLQSALPNAWKEGTGRLGIVVPVQLIETWLLVLRGAPLEPTPEQASAYNRNALKKKFFGKTTPPLATRIALAKAELEKPNALDLLEERPSFRRFAERVAAWRIA